MNSDRRADYERWKRAVARGIPESHMPTFLFEEAARAQLERDELNESLWFWA